jgi:WD40 repeat protein
MNFIADQCLDYPLTIQRGSKASFTYYTARLAEKRLGPEQSMIALSFSQDQSGLTFALCEGTESSFSGGLAADFLVKKLLAGLEQIQPGNAPLLIQHQLEDLLKGWVSEGAQWLTQQPLPGNLPLLLQRALEKKRLAGSECKFACGRVEYPSPSLPEGSVVLAQLGDIQLLSKGEQAAWKAVLSRSESAVGVWSTSRGVVGSITTGIFPFLNEHLQKTFPEIMLRSSAFVGIRPDVFLNSPDFQSDPVERQSSTLSEHDVAYLQIQFDDSPERWERLKGSRAGDLLINIAIFGSTNPIPIQRLKLIALLQHDHSDLKELLDSLTQENLLNPIEGENVELIENMRTYLLGTAEYQQAESQLSHYLEHMNSALLDVTLLESCKTKFGVTNVSNELVFAASHAEQPDLNLWDALKPENLLEWSGKNPESFFLQQWRNLCFERDWLEPLIQAESLLTKRQLVYLALERSRKNANSAPDHSQAITQILVSQDELWALSCAENDVIMWDLNSRTTSGQRSLSYSFQAEPHSCTHDIKHARIAFYQYQTSSVQILELPSLEITQEIKDVEAGIIDLEISPDGQWLAACLSDNTIKIWDIPSGEFTGLFPGHSQFTCLRWLPSGLKLVAGDQAGTVQFLRLVTPS